MKQIVKQTTTEAITPELITAIINAVNAIIVVIKILTTKK